MGATKIINVLRDDKFEELLDIVKNTDASEVIFVMPKKTKAFKSEGHFVVLADEAKDSDKSISFLCSNPDVNKFAEKYSFDTLSTKTEKKVKPVKRELTEPVAVPRQTSASQNLGGQAVVAKDADDESDEVHDERDSHHPLSAREEEEKENPNGTKGEETEYKEEENEPKAIKDEPPYGTELDESGNPVYDEKEEKKEDLITPIKMETHKEEADIRSVWGERTHDNIWDDISTKTRAHPDFNVKSYPPAVRPKSKKSIGILSAVSVLILASTIYLTTGSAKIEIVPRAKELNFELKISTSPNFSSVNNSFNRIPGQLFTVNKSAVDEFNATSEKDAVQKSRGTITIYNEYGTSPQPLVATTRFEFMQGGKESGLVFKTLQTITVPGMRVENDVITPGRVDVEVIADKAGQTYNVPAGDFSIVAWREKGDVARYEKIYGRSDDSTHGGILGKAKVVSEFDYNNAKDHLTARVVSDINTSLEPQTVGLELLTNIEPKIDSVESTAGIDDAADNFTMTVNGSIATIGFKKDDLISLITDRVDKTEGLMVVPEKLELSYKDVVINSDNVMEMIVSVKGNAYAKIDKNDIASNLLGRNEAQIKEHLGSIEGINSAKVILSPFWVKKIPKNEGKINIFFTY